MKGKVDVMIMPQTDKELRSTKFWLLSKDIDYKIVYIPVEEVKMPVFLTIMSRWQKLLYQLTFGRKTHHVSCF